MRIIIVSGLRDIVATLSTLLVRDGISTVTTYTEEDKERLLDSFPNTSTPREEFEPMRSRFHMALAIALAVSSQPLNASSCALSASQSGRLLYECTPFSVDKTKHSFMRYDTLCIRHTSRRNQNVFTVKMQFRGAPKDARVNKRKTYIKKLKKR